MATQRVISRDTGIEDSDYKWGFVIDIESDVAPKGLNEDIIRFIWAKKGEPDWMLEWRLKAYRHWVKQNQEEPTWANVSHPPIDFQDIIYYAAPVTKADGPKGLDEVDPELVEAFNKLGIPIEEQKKLSGVAVDAVLDSVSVATTYHPEAPRPGEEVHGVGGALHRQLLRQPQLGGVQRRLLRLHTQGSAVSHGADDLLPHQPGRLGPVRAHPDHRRRRQLR